MAQRVAARRHRDRKVSVGTEYQVASIPDAGGYPVEDSEWRDVGTRINLDEPYALVAHNFFEESSGRLTTRIATFLKEHPHVTRGAREDLKTSGLEDYIRVRGGRWYVYRGG